MKCPNCQNEMKDDQLYCEKCGYEICIVPEFEPEMEDSIKEELTSAVNELIPESEAPQSSDNGNDEYEDDERPSLFLFLIRQIKRHKLLLLIPIGLVTVALLFGMRQYLSYQQAHSYEYQYQQALLSADAGAYTEAIGSLENALRLDGSQTQLRMLMADYELAAGDTTEAERAYLELIQFTEYEEEAYEKLIAIYERQENYQAICALLRDCENEKIRTKYTKYLAEKPVFSINSGVYEDSQRLKITANTEGIIYYTLDGTVPNEAGMVYTEPITLDSGSYEVQAVFINSYGEKSEIESGVFLIHVEIPLEPVISPTGGDYTVPEYITVEVPQGCTVYYTTDGTVPDENSFVYTRALCMPLGETTYRMVSYSSDFIASEVTQVEYHLNLDSPLFSEYQAMLITASGLTDQGILLNMEGESPDAAGIYSYEATAAFVYEEELYYLMTEYYTDLNERVYTTQTRYAVSANYGVLYKTAVDETGHYSVIAFE